MPVEPTLMPKLVPMPLPHVDAGRIDRRRRRRGADHIHAVDVRARLRGVAAGDEDARRRVVLDLPAADHELHVGGPGGDEVDARVALTRDAAAGVVQVCAAHGERAHGGAGVRVPVQVRIPGVLDRRVRDGVASADEVLDVNASILDDATLRLYAVAVQEQVYEVQPTDRIGGDAAIAAVIDGHAGEGRVSASWTRSTPSAVVFWIAPPVQVAALEQVPPLPVTVRPAVRSGRKHARVVQQIPFVAPLAEMLRKVRPLAPMVVLATLSAVPVVVVMAFTTAELVGGMAS